MFAWPLIVDQRAGELWLTVIQRQPITCISALCINPSGLGILALKGRQRRGCVNDHTPNYGVYALLSQNKQFIGWAAGIVNTQGRRSPRTLAGRAELCLPGVCLC